MSDHDGQNIYISVMESSEVVRCSIDELPLETEDLLEVLAAEAAPLSTWFDFARAYLAQGNIPAFKQICEEGVRPEVIVEVERFFGAKPIYEQIQFLCGLASVEMNAAKEEKDKGKKAEHISVAAQHLASAKILDDEEQLVHLGLGILALVKGELPAARQEFSRASQLRNNKKRNIAGHLALASVLYNQQQYKEALQWYCRALREHPSCPAEVRLGIAACQLKLGDLSASQMAYERVLKLDPDNADALLGLAVIKFNSPSIQQGLADGLKLLIRAHELDPGHVGTLNMMAHLCLLRGDHQQALTLGRSALEACDGPMSVDATRADCHCIIARASHALGNFAEASKNYNAAIRQNPSLPLPHLGMAQWWLSQGLHNSINASSELEAALKLAPTFYDALKILGQLIYDNPDKVEKTLKTFQEAARRRDEDADMWELLAELLAPRDPQGSLKAYQHALGLHRKRHEAVKKLQAEQKAAAKDRSSNKKKAAKAGQEGDGMEDLFGSDEDDEDGENVSVADVADVADAQVTSDHVIPSRLLNNAAVLFYRSGMASEALALTSEALQNQSKETSSTSSGTSNASKHQQLTLEYNRGRLLEAVGEYLAAKKEYQAILSRHDAYIDCYLRLACISRRMGASSDAISWATKALELQGGHADALALMSQLYLERRDYKQAHDTIKKLLDNKATATSASQLDSQVHKQARSLKDGYGMLSLGNLNLALVPSDRRKEADANKAADVLNKAKDQYMAVLKSDIHNVYAANGIGAVLAEMGLLQEAKEVFNEVQAAVAASGGFLDIPDLYINLANVSLASEDYTGALRLYKVAMGKLDANKQSQVLLYLARGHYDSDDLKSAKHCLLRAIHIAPTDYKLRFNAALTMQEWAVRVYRKKRDVNDTTKLPEYRQAQSDLRLALKYFEQLVSKGKVLTQLDEAKLTAHVKFCTDQISNADVHIKAAELEAEEQEAKKKSKEKLRMLAEAEKELEKLKRDEAQKKMIHDLELRAKAAREHAERNNDEWRLRQGHANMADGAPEGGGQGGKGKRKRKDKGGGKGGRPRRDDGEEEEEVAASGSGDERAAEEEEIADVDALFGDDDDEEEADPGVRHSVENGDDGGGRDAAPGQGRKTVKRVGAEQQDGGSTGNGLEDLEDDQGLQDDAVGPVDEEGGYSQPSAKKAKRGAAIESDEEAEEGVGLQDVNGGPQGPGATEVLGPEDEAAMVDSLFADD